MKVQSREVNFESQPKLDQSLLFNHSQWMDLIPARSLAQFWNETMDSSFNRKREGNVLETQWIENLHP
jgi:hypothetical protein